MAAFSWNCTTVPRMFYHFSVHCMMGCASLQLHFCLKPLTDFCILLHYRYFENHQANDFPAISAVLRLSTKYLVEHLRQRCLKRLDHDWPSSLAGWDRRELEATDEHGRYVPRDLCPHPILVIDLALSLGLSSFLPAAFYDLSRYGPSKILAGTFCPSQPFPISSSVVPSPPENISPTSIHLSQHFLYRTFRGRESSQRYMATFIEKELQGRAPSPKCTNKDDNLSRACHESFYFIMLNILRSVGGIACGRDGDPLFTLIQAMDMLSRMDFSDGQKQCGLKLCHSCKVDFAASATKAREEVWSMLPKWFALEGEGGNCDL